jgi:orotidine-5'-phosphate decarboxylase
MSVQHIIAREPEAAERLIVALDFNAPREALALVDRLEDSVSFYKVGLELFVTAGPAIVEELQRRGHKIFLDLKIDDVVETITRTVRQIASMQVDLMTILGGPPTMDAAVAGRADNALPRILSVTLLTSLNQSDLEFAGLLGHPGARFESVEHYVRWRAETAIAHGCDGLITSGTNAAMLRQHLGAGPLLVTPGIRPAGASLNEHKRPCTPFDSIRDGADYIVVGRPIRDAPHPPDAARAIIADIEAGLAARS